MPEEFQDEMCPKPDDMVMERVKNDKRDKAKAKIAGKKCKATVLADVS